MKTTHSTKAPTTKESSKLTAMIGKAINTKESINAYFKGEITLNELNDRGIKFVRTI